MSDTVNGSSPHTANTTTNSAHSAWFASPTAHPAARFDPAVPPPGQFAVYNALAGPKELFVLRAGHFDHAGTIAEDRRLLDALAYFFNRD